MSGSKRGAGAAALLAAGIAASIGSLVLFAWLAGRIATGEGLPFDAMVRGWVHAHSSAPLTTVMRAMSFLGEVPVLIILSAGAVWVLTEIVRWPRAALLFVVAMLGGLILDASLKGFFHRARPEAFFGTALPHSYSFPSGHALYSVCFWGVLAALAAYRIRGRGARVGIWAAAASIAGLTGYSRIYLGVHYPSDVVGGYAAAVVWVATLAGVDRALRRRGRNR